MYKSNRFYEISHSSFNRLTVNISLFTMDSSLTYEPSDLFSNEPWEHTIPLDGSIMPQVRADYVPPPMVHNRSREGSPLPPSRERSPMRDHVEDLIALPSSSSLSRPPIRQVTRREPPLYNIKVIMTPELEKMLFREYGH